jgi:hypothetical protein
MILCLLFILTACESAQVKKIGLQPCLVGNISAKCGTLSVFENRAAQSGRKIDIHVAVIKARGSDPARDPIFYLTGGPGGSAIQDAEYALLILTSANERRDIVREDPRGRVRNPVSKYSGTYSVLREGVEVKTEVDDGVIDHNA